MSNPIDIVEATPVHYDEDLQGTPSAASFPPTDGENVPLTAAYPVDNNFEYTEATMARAEAQYQQEVQAQREAYPLDQNNRTALSDDSRSRVKYGGRTGVIQQEAENQAIRRNNRKVFAHDYHERQAFETANRNARAVDTLERMGRTPAMTENRPTPTPPAKEKEDSGSKESSGGYKMGGYEVKEYSVGSYECNDYNISEYKSVYD